MSFFGRLCKCTRYRATRWNNLSARKKPISPCTYFRSNLVVGRSRYPKLVDKLKAVFEKTPPVYRPHTVDAKIESSVVCLCNYNAIAKSVIGH